MDIFNDAFANGTNTDINVDVESVEIETTVEVEIVEINETDDIRPDAEYLETLDASTVPFTNSSSSSATSDRFAFWERLNSKNDEAVAADAADSASDKVTETTNNDSKVIRRATDQPKTTASRRTPAPQSEIVGFYSGGGTSGQLGSGQSSNILELAPLVRGVVSQQNISFVACSMHHSLMCTKDGVMFSCGANERGELGRSGQKRKLFRAIESIPERIVMVAAGQNFSVVLTARGSMFSWGVNGRGQLGHGTRQDCRRPKKVAGLSSHKIVQLVCGQKHSLCLSDTGKVFAWGDASSGTLGNGTYVSSDRPIHLKQLDSKGVLSVASGQAHCLARTTCGALYAWGNNKFGQLGFGDKQNRLRPTEVQTMRVAKCIFVAAGSFHTVCISGAGLVFTMGQGHQGQLGHGAETAPQLTPRVVESLRDKKIMAAACGLRHTILLESGGKRYHAFGCNSSGQLGLKGVHNRKKPEAGAFGGPNMGRVFCGGNSTFFTCLGNDGVAMRASGLIELSAKHIGDSVVAVRQAPESEQEVLLLGLRKKIIAGFGSISILNKSFLREEYHVGSSTSKRIRRGCSADLGLDMTEVNAVYKHLVNSGFDPLVRTLGVSAVKLSDELMKCKLEERSQLRAVVVLLANPLLLSRPQDFFVVCKGVVSFLSTLKSSLRQFFFQAIEALGRKFYTGVTEIFRHHIAQSIVRGNSNIWPIALVLKQLWRTNSRTSWLHPASYYVPEIRSMFDLKADFDRWGQSGGVFTLQQFPFLLDGEAKRQFIRIESTQNMIRMLEGNSAYSNFLQSHHGYSALDLPRECTFVLSIRRQFLLNDTLRKVHEIVTTSPAQFKKPMAIMFEGEAGVDQGGLLKEFFQLIVRDLFSPEHRLFRVCESGKYWFCKRYSDVKGWDQQLMMMLGVIFGLATYNGVLLDAQFPMAMYHKLLDRKDKAVSVKARLALLSEIDPAVAKSLKHMLEFKGDVEHEFEQTFSVTVDCKLDDGSTESKELPLKPNSQNVPVTNGNCLEFVRLYVQWLLDKSVAKFFDPFRDGFMLIMHGRALRLCLPEELDVLACGRAELGDFRELQATTKYAGGFTAETPVVQWFWEVVLEELNEAQLRKLLSFVTGCDRVPVLGLQTLRFIIQKSGSDDDHLPSAHTCFNMLDLPAYSSKEILRSRLMKALEYTVGFGLV